ncbi:MAG: hypothetical protein WAO58_00635 [Fimbriimonadaceae bacterium]
MVLPILLLILPNQYAREPVVNPQWSKSSDRRYTLYVNPSEPDGAGPGDYTFSDGKRILWRARHPFTLAKAAVSTNGMAAGYSHSKGPDGFFGERRDDGDVRFVIIRPDGTLVLNESVPRKFSTEMHSWPIPEALGVRLDEKRDMVLFEVRGDGPSGWRTYSLSTGKRMADPAEPPVPSGRRRFPRTAAKSTISWKPVSLAYLGKTVIPERVPEMSPLLRDIDEFVMAGPGRIAFLSRDDTSLVVVDYRGRVLSRVSLSSIPKGKESFSGLCWTGGNRFVVTRNTYTPEAAMAWRIDSASGSMKRLASFRAPGVEAIAGFMDGGFVVIARKSIPYGLETTLTAYDLEGRQRWKKTEERSTGPNDPPSYLGMVNDVAVTSNGNVVVVDPGPSTVQVFSRNGKFLRLTDLTSKVGESAYTSDVAAAANGGVTVLDFMGDPPILRLDAKGKLVARFAPKYADSRPIELRDAPQTDSNGRLWISDGFSMLRLAENGTVDRILGDRANPTKLGGIGEMAVRNGKIYCKDERTEAVHVYGLDGRRQVIASPRPTDFGSTGMSFDSMQITRDGHIYVWGAGEDIGFLHFAPSGKRVGIDRFQENVATWGQPYRWNRRSLYDRSGKLLLRLRRRPNNAWLESSGPYSEGEDGSLALLDTAGDWARGPETINHYDRNGKPLEMFELESAIKARYVTHDAERVLLSNGKSIYCFSWSGVPQWKFTPPGKTKDWFVQPFLGRNQVLYVRTDARTVVRYKMPAKR